jgi:enoyl-CoA hydratase
LTAVAKAKEPSCTGAIIDAVEAEWIGLVNRVGPHDQLMVATNDLAQRIMRHGPLTVRMAKQAVNAGMNYGPLAGQEHQRPAQTILFATEDRLEGRWLFWRTVRPILVGGRKEDAKSA